MALKKFNPVTPGLRFRVATDFAEVTKGTPEKSLLAPNKKSGGRNNAGHMTMRYIGGGHKRRYRIIDFKRSKFDVPAVVKAIEYDPNRTAFIALIYYKDGEKSYILAPQGLNVGQEIVSGKSVAPEVGNTLPLGNMPLGSIIHNVELHPGKGGNMCRSAGSSAQLLAKDGKYVAIKLPSGEQRMILATCLATIGSVSNSDHANTIMGKAGRKRWAGRRPRVRGVAMNPVDHPMGGGEGRASGGHPRSRKGIPAKGYKTRQKNKSSERLIINRKGKK
jgi:large subunit ribosomal protein L2